MKALVVSDSHANQYLLRKALECFEVDYIFHLGDYFEDMDENPDFIENCTVVKVPGIMHPGYLNKKLNKIERIKLKKWNIALVHDIKDFKNQKADLCLFGHSHAPTVAKEKNIFYVNPGHIKKEIDRGYKASFAILEIEESKITVNHHYINGEQFSKKVIEKQ